MGATGRARWVGRALRWGARALFVLAACALLVEAGFRWVLFHPGRVSNALVQRLPVLRHPASYAGSRDDRYWRLRYRLLDPARRGPEARWDGLLGWVSAAVEPGSYAHRDERRLDERRPILLFGDSFAAHGGPGHHFQELLASSDLGERYAMLNYGVGGWGFGQIALACRTIAPRFLERDPVVIVSLFVDDDLDRTALDFREWPQPSFRVGAGGRIERDEEPLPRTRQAYLDEHGTGIGSYAWRFFVRRSPLAAGLRQREEAERDRRVRSVNRAVLDELVADLDAWGVEWFFLVFHGQHFLAGNSPYQVREDFLLANLRRLGAPYVLSRAALKRDALLTGRRWQDYWIESGAGAGHLTDLGNEVVMRALRDGLEGRFHTAR